MQNSVQTFPDFGVEQCPIVCTLGRAIIRRFCRRIWGVVHGYDCRDPAPSLVSKESISSIASALKLSRPTVRKHCRTQCELIYRRDKQPTPMLEARIASSEMLPSVGLLPHVICSPPGFGGGEHEADQHGDTR